MNKDRNSIYSKVFENCGNYFSLTCEDLISGLRGFDDQAFIEYLKTFKFSDSKFQNSLFACGNIGAARPLESFNFILESFPEIDINSKSQPSSRTTFGGSNFLYLLGNVKWDDKYERSCVKYTIDYIITKVWRYITMQSTQTMHQKDSVEIINKVYSFVNSRTDPFYDSMNMLLIDELKMVVSYASVNSQTEIFDIIQPILFEIESQSDDHQALVINLFSDAYFKFEKESQVKDLLDSVNRFYNGKGKTSEAASAFILNVLGQAFVLFNSYCSCEVTTEYYNKSIQYSDQYSFELRALILSFTTNKALKMNIKEFSQKCFSDHSKDKHDHSEHIMKALIRYLYGKNYVPRPLQYLGNVHYSWHCSKEEYQETLEMLEIVKKNHSILVKVSTKTLSEFLLQIACNDVNFFSDEVIKKLAKDETTFNAIEEAVLITFLNILAINTNFICKANIEKSEVEKVILKIKEEGYKMCKKLLKGVDSESSLSIYITPSFTQSLNTICSLMKHSVSDIHAILTSPIMISSSDQEFAKPKLLGVYLNKWKKINPIFEEKPKSILDDDEDHRRTKIASKAHSGSSELSDLLKSLDHNKNVIAALNLAPLILTPSNNNKMLELIESKVISKEEAVGAVAVRSLQASIHLNLENATKIINYLYLHLTKNVSTVTPDSIFVIVSALKNILETVAFERIQLNKSDFEHSFFIISLGLISSCFITRTVALDALKIIQNPVVSSFQDKLDEIISDRGKELIFDVLCPGTEDVDEIEPIKFTNFAKSKSCYLYTFYVAAFSEKLKNYDFNENEIGISSSIPRSSSDSAIPVDALADYKDIIDSTKVVMDDLRKFLLELLIHSKNFDHDDPYFVIYISSFLFAVWNDDEMKEKQKHGIQHYIKKLNELNINGIEDWIAASISSIPPLLFSSKLVNHLPPRAFALYLLKCTQEPNFIENNCLNNSEAFKLGYSKFINSIFKLKYISKEATFSINNPKAIKNNDQTALFAFGEANASIFAELAKKQMRTLSGCNGIFPRNPITKQLVDDVLTTNESYAFWFNLSSENNLYFSIACQNAYEELVKFMYIPDIWFELVKNNIEKIVDHTPDIAITLFTNYSGILMPIYVRNSQTSYPFFAGIAKQICPSDIFFNEWKSKIADVYQSGSSENVNDEFTSLKPIQYEENESADSKSIVSKAMNAAKRLSDLILRNIGTLQAIATSYLIGNDVYQRMTAFDFIYATAISAHLIYADDATETLTLSEELLSVKDTFMTNFEQFFANTASKVICSLADHLPFLSEQFCSGIFAIESIKGVKREISENIRLKATKEVKKDENGKPGRIKNSIIPLPPMAKSSTMNLGESGIRGVTLTGIAQYSLNNNIPANLNSSSAVLKKANSLKRISTSNNSQSSSLALIPMATIDPENKEQLVLSSFDKNSKETCRYIISLIVPWIKRIRYVPERLHIFEGCLPSYQMFSMYTFIQSIVKLKSLLPITPPITNILYPTYKACGTSFLIILTHLYFSMKELRENCVAMITYAYTINSKHVLKYFMAYLNVRFWYYQNIQISKLNQAFDFRLFLQEMQSTENAEENEDQEKYIDSANLISFILKMLIIFLRENPMQILPYKNMIIVFCALNFRQYSTLAQELFYLLLNVKPPGALKTEKSINYIGPYTYEPTMEILKESIMSHIISLIKPSLYSSSPSSLSTAIAAGAFNLGAVFAPDEMATSFHKTYSFEKEISNDPTSNAAQINQQNALNIISIKNKTAVISAYSPKEISQYLIEWGLICGDSFIASMALKMFITLEFKATESEINYALNSIYLIYLMIKDAAMSRSTNGRQTLLKLADSDAKPDYAIAYSHIEYLCKLCQNVASDPSADLVNRILLTSFALMLLPEPGKIIKDQTKAKPDNIITESLRNIYLYRDYLVNFNPDKLIEAHLDSSEEVDNQNNESASKSSHSDNSNYFQGFIFYLFNSSLNDESLELSQKIIIYLMQKKLSYLLNGKNNNPAFTYYAIIPFIFARKSTFNSEDEIKEPDIKKAFVDVSAHQSPESLEKFHDVLLEKGVSKNEKNVSKSFEMLFNFYKTVIKIGSTQEIKAVLILSSLIVRDQLLDNSAQVLGEISREIIQKRDHELKENVNEFYKLLVTKYGGQISSQKKLLSSKNLPDLIGGIIEKDVLEWRPVEPLSESNETDATSEEKSESEKQIIKDESDSDDNEISTSRLNNSSDFHQVDPFKNPKYYPPIFLTDYALFVSEFMNNLLPVVEQIKVQPYTHWSEEIFSEMASQQNNKLDNPNENSIAVCFDDELEDDKKEALSKTDNKVKKIVKELKRKLTQKNKNESKDSNLATTINPVHSSAKYCFVNADLFCPDLKIVDSIGNADNSNQTRLPSII